MKLFRIKLLIGMKLKKLNTSLQNDLYEKHQVEVIVRGEMLVCNDITKMKVYNKKIKKETYQEYLDKNRI